MHKEIINIIVSLILLGTSILLPVKDNNSIVPIKDPDTTNPQTIEVVQANTPFYIPPFTDYDNPILEEFEMEDLRFDYLEGTFYIDDSGQVIITNVDDNLVLVNKNRNLPSTYIPSDLVVAKVKFSFVGIHEKSYLRQEAASALEELFHGAEEEGIVLYAMSGYRAYSTQKGLFDLKSKDVGSENANLLLANPGQSEHQTGLAMDVSSESANLALNKSFENTAEGKWLKINAHKYGFILRYQEDTSEITGYSYEPWHIRYVGKDFSEKIYESGLTLEEFLGDI